MSLSVAVDAERRVVLLDLLGLDLGEGLDGVEAGVLGEGEGDGLQGLGEGAECVLLDGLDLKRKRNNNV